LLSAPPYACPAATTVLKGCVTDYSSGKPVTAAIVSLQAFAVIRKRIGVSTASSASGEYRIESPLSYGIYRMGSPQGEEIKKERKRLNSPTKSVYTPN